MGAPPPAAGNDAALESARAALRLEASRVRAAEAASAAHGAAIEQAHEKEAARLARAARAARGPAGDAAGGASTAGAEPSPTVLSQGLSFEPVRAPGRSAPSGKSGRPVGWRSGCGLGYSEFRAARSGADGADAAVVALAAGAAGSSSEAPAGAAGHGGRPVGWRRGCGLGYRCLLYTSPSPRD